MCVCVCFGIYVHNIFLVFHMFASFYYLVIHSILFHYIHAFIWISYTPLIIFMFLRWSFIASCTLCQSWQKRGEIVENMWFLSKILHVRGRNTFLVRGRMCFILLGGGLTSFFFNLRSCDHVYIHYAYIWWCMSSSPTLSCVVSFLPLYTCFLFLYAIYLFLLHSKMP